MDIKYMHAAIREAQKAADIGETPIGAVIVHGEKIIARAHNMREIKKNALMHAEIIAIGKACKKLGGWRLPECDIYVTLEPCPMCMGAIIQARIENLYFGAFDLKSGCAGSVCDLSGLLPHKVNAVGGIERVECEAILKSFFRNLRKREK